MSPKSSLVLLLALSAGAAASLPASAFSQAVSVNGGSIQGTITDSTGAAVPNATITIKGTDTGLSKTITTDSAGFYSVGPLNPGNYSITISQTGFQTTTINTVVRTGTATAGSSKLTVGNTSQSIEVTADALQVNTDQTSVSDVITRQQIDALPINGRNFLDVAQVEPGVILESGETFDPTKAGYSAISVSGVSGRTTRILLDGQDITDETVGTTIVNVTTGAIDEFQLNRSTQDVSGEVTSTGQVLVATRSGTNAVHGQLFYNFQDHRVGFARTTDGLDTPFQRNQFGGDVGGPIIKDKLFFFADSERIKQDNQAAASTSPTFAAIQAAYPSIPSPFRDTFSVGRLDYQAPKGIHMFARVFYEANSAFSNYGDLYSLYNTRNNVPGINGGADFTTGKFTHSVRVGYEKFHNILNGGTSGVTSIYNPLPDVTLFDAQDGFFAGPNYLAPQGTFQSDKQARYDGTWTKGSHTVKFGASLNYILGGGFAEFYGASLFTEFGPSTLVAGNGSDPINDYAGVYILGNGNGSFTEVPQFGLAGGGTHDWRSGAYLADTWKVKPSFTLVAGLRWSVDTDRANQDLPTPLCSSLAPSLQFTGCTGNTPLFDQFQQGLGKKTHQPYGDFGPQLGFVFSPGAQKTSVQGGIGIFYESDIFNNTTNARTSVIQANGPYFNATGVCGGVNSVTLPNGTQVSSVNGVSLSTICGEPISQATPQIQVLKSQYDTASAGNGPNPAYIGNGGGLKAAGVYAAPYVQPYSIQFNGGVQHEIFKGAIISANYVHTATLKVPLSIDVNHVGAARFLNTTAAKTAVATTLTACGAATIEAAAAVGGCPGLHPGTATTPAGGATIADFASNGLDSSNQYTGGYPVSFTGQAPAAFAGANPNVGLGQFILPVGRSGYDALQLVYRQQVSHPVPGILNGNFQASYSLSRSQNPISGTNNSDEFFNSLPYDYDNPNEFIGRSALDHTNELSFGGGVNVKYGLNIGVVGHFFSAPPTTLTLDNQSNNVPGEIFRTDVTGDGTVGDVVPGTEPGDYMHRYKGANLAKLINNYNATEAGQPTPAGLALINAGVLTQSQLTLLNGVQQQIHPLTQGALLNPAFRTFDINATYPIHLSRIRGGLSIEPGVAMYNVANLANFSHLNGVLANTTTYNNAATAGGVLEGYLNGDTGFAAQNALRTQRGSGTFDQGAPRTTEFQLKLNF